MNFRNAARVVFLVHIKRCWYMYTYNRVKDSLFDTLRFFRNKTVIFLLLKIDFLSCYPSLNTDTLAEPR